MAAMTAMTALTMPTTAIAPPVTGAAPPVEEGVPTVLQVIAWEDPLLDSAGFDPRSRYVETFWLPILGPSACDVSAAASQMFHVPVSGGAVKTISRLTASAFPLVDELSAGTGV
jgi:hypothetical protein